MNAHARTRERIMSVDWRSFDACKRNPIEIVYCLEMFSILSEIGCDWHWSDRFILIARCPSTYLNLMLTIQLEGKNYQGKCVIALWTTERSGLSLSRERAPASYACSNATCTHHCTIKEATLFLFDRAYCDIIIIKREENDRERRRNEQMNDRSLSDQADSCAQRETEKRERERERGRKNIDIYI